MVNIFDDGSVFVGELVNGQKQGKGMLYFLADMYAECRVAGEWKDNKPNGRIITTTRDYKEIGHYDNGVKNGDFTRDYFNGNYSVLTYNNGVCVNRKDVISTVAKRKVLDRILVRQNGNKKIVYIGEVWNKQPWGYGMLYHINCDKSETFVRKEFCHIFGKHIVEKYDINENKGKTL